MKFDHRFAAAAFVLLTAFTAPAGAQEFKPGQWEYTMQLDMPNRPVMPQIPPDQLAKMPPDVRARIQQMQQGRGMTFSSCLTADKPVPQNPRNRSCTIDKMERSGGTVHWTATCKSPEGQVSKAEATAVYTGTTMTMDMIVHVDRDGQPMTMKQHTTGRYIGPCGQ